MPAEARALRAKPKPGAPTTHDFRAFLTEAALGESFGFLAHEVVAAGRPVVAHRVGSLLGLPGDVSGVVVAPGLSEALFRRARYEELRQCLGRRTAAHGVGQFALERMIGNTVDHYAPPVSDPAPFIRPATFADRGELTELRAHNPSGDGRIRVLQIIARLNVGGPALMAAVLSDLLDPGRFDQRIVAGSIGEGEGDYVSLRAPHLAVLESPRPGAGASASR